MKEEYIKLFWTSHQMVESDLDKVELNNKIDLDRNRGLEEEIDKEYYPQFPEEFREEAAEMAKHYELIYCLEKSIRNLIEDKFIAEEGTDWWEKCIPDDIKLNVKRNIENEQNEGFTQRSEKIIDYTTFGELSVIVKNNWSIFSDTFRNDKAFTKIMKYLNSLRSPIAHCSPLAEDEVVRLKLTIRDWYRLME